MSRSAAELLEARSHARLVPLPSTREPGFDLGRAYQVAEELRRTLVAEGHRVVGRKLGFTNESIWPELGLAEPIWAPIYEQTVELDGVRHSLAGAVGPRLELELVVKLSSVSPLAFEWVALGYEIVQCHYADWRFTCADALADFGLHRGLLVGPPAEATPDLSRELPELEVALYRDGERVARGDGKDVLGGPVRAVQWLQRILDRQPDAPPLEAGEIVITGALTGAHPVAAGERWSAEVTSGVPLNGTSIAISP